MAAAKLKAYFGIKAAERRLAAQNNNAAKAVPNNYSEQGDSRDLAAKKFNVSGVSVDRAGSPFCWLTRRVSLK